MIGWVDDQNFEGHLCAIIYFPLIYYLSYYKSSKIYVYDKMTTLYTHMSSYLIRWTAVYPFHSLFYRYMTFFFTLLIYLIYFRPEITWTVELLLIRCNYKWLYKMFFFFTLSIIYNLKSKSHNIFYIRFNILKL